MAEGRPEAWLSRTRAFWDQNPCDGHPNVAQRLTFRYRKEPWLPPVLDRIARHDSILEVGCGQGSDALYACMRMRAGGTYWALDLSPASVASARRSAWELGGRLIVSPEFIVGNAERLEFRDGAFSCAVSLGALHHTRDPQRAVDELHRVLRAGGTAFVSLYRLWSPKLLAAHFLRGVGRAVDGLAGGEGRLCGLLRRAGAGSLFGTMLLECFGVPILRSFTRRQVRRLFRRFSIEEILPVGLGFSLFGANSLFDGRTHPLGAQWLVVARKPARGAAHDP